MVDPRILEGLTLDDEVTSSSAGDDDETISHSSEFSSEGSSSDDSSEGDSSDSSLSSLSSSGVDEDAENGLILTLSMIHQLRRSTSSGNLMDDGKAKRRGSVSSDGLLHPKKDIAKAISVVQTRSANELPLHRRLAERSVPSPTTTYEKCMEERGVEVTYRTSDFLRERDFFVAGSQVGYSLELMNAVGKHDMRYLRKHHKSGGNLQCNNRFGESLVHAVVRKGTAEMLQFLIDVGKVPLQVCCDGGRTPLHDACWSATPCFEMIRLLLTECPELLLVKDKRGFSPLGYVPRDTYSLWNEFLLSNTEILGSKGVFRKPEQTSLSLTDGRYFL